MGQTKVVEDSLTELRDVQNRAVLNKRLEAERQWNALKGVGTVGMHGRDEIVTPEDWPMRNQQLDKGIFKVKGVVPSLDLLPLISPATWPTLSA